MHDGEHFKHYNLETFQCVVTDLEQSGELREMKADGNGLSFAIEWEDSMKV